MKKSLRFMAVAAVLGVTSWLSTGQAAQAGWQQCFRYHGHSCSQQNTYITCLDDQALHQCLCWGTPLTWDCGLD